MAGSIATQLCVRQAQLAALWGRLKVSSEQVEILRE